MEYYFHRAEAGFQEFASDKNKKKVYGHHSQDHLQCAIHWVQFKATFFLEENSFRWFRY